MDDVAGEITVTINSTDKKYSNDVIGVTVNSTDEEIVDALTPILEEDEGFNLREEFDQAAYTIKRMDNSNNIYIFPKSTAGY